VAPTEFYALKTSDGTCLLVSALNPQSRTGRGSHGALRSPPDSRLRERRDNRARFVYAPDMSTAEIINELPKLPEADRRAIREVLLGIANEDPDVALCNQTAMEGAMMLDQMESDDARDRFWMNRFAWS
jgi:hypothetical protein